jgi:hypothetical protein
MSGPLKYAASVEQIAEAEGLSVGAVTMLLSRALRKLRKHGLLITARQLALELEEHRATENNVRTGRRHG